MDLADVGNYTSAFYEKKVVFLRHMSIKMLVFSFNKFCGNASVSFRQVTRDRLRRYGEHLYDSGLKPKYGINVYAYASQYL